MAKGKGVGKVGGGPPLGVLSASKSTGSGPVCRKREQGGSGSGSSAHLAASDTVGCGEAKGCVERGRVCCGQREAVYSEHGWGVMASTWGWCSVPKSLRLLLQSGQLT